MLEHDFFSRLLLDNPLEFIEPPPVIVTPQEAVVVPQVTAASSRIASELQTESDNILSWVDQNGLRLYPAQRFVLKMAYGIPLSDRDQISFEEHPAGRRRSFTERDYLSFLYDEGRSNTRAQVSNPGEFFLATGRRTGKTLLAALMCLYEARRLHRIGNFSQYYGFTPGTVVSIANVGVDFDQVRMTTREMLHILRSDPILRASLVSNTGDRHLSLSGVQIRGLTSTSRGRTRVRGVLWSLGVLDEMAYYREDPYNDLYNSISPSIAAFSPKDARGLPTGPCEGKMIALSTPRGLNGSFHTHFTRAESPYSVALRIPSWEMNPTIDSFLRQAIQQDGARFFTEYAAQFTSLLE